MRGIAGSKESNDCLITIESSDKKIIEINSIVGAFFYDQILDTVEKTLKQQGLENVKVVVEDKGQPQYQQPQPQQPQPQQQPPQYQQFHQNPVNVQAFQLENFEEQGSMMGLGVDINLIKDVPLEITGELGRTSKQISDILDFGVGTVIELDRLVGEPLDILANGKRIARGEVVVVDENYGIRITDIIVSEKIVNNI